MIKVIAFDYADVIAPSSLSKWVRENLQKTDEKYIHYKKHSPKWDSGQMSVNEVYNVLSFVTDTPSHLIWERFYENLDADEKVVELIKSLRTNYKVFLFSNFVGELLRKLLKKQGIENIFDDIIISSEHKLMKPHPKFFDILIKKSEVLPNEMLFIDDRLPNIETAKNLGINAIHFENCEKLEKDLKSVGVKF